MAALGLSDSEPQVALAEAAGLATDGAIVRAQTGGAAVEQALAALERLLGALTPA